MARRELTPDVASRVRKLEHFGHVVGLLTLLFLMGVALLTVATGKEIRCSARFPIVAVLGLGSALAGGAIGGTASAKGTLPIPGFGRNPMAVAAGGGVAVLVIVMLAGHFIYVQSCNSENTNSGAKGLSYGTPKEHAAPLACEGPLNVKLDQLLGQGAWFVYPDDNRTEIGVRRIPTDFRIIGVVKRVDNDDGTFVAGDSVRRPIGSNIALACPWRDADIPLWQRDAITRWRAARSADTAGVTRDRVEAIFGSKRWTIVKGFAYAAEGIPSRAVPMVYPITSLDVNNLKYGIGDETVAARGEKVRIWFAGNIR